ncbi:hypothetical protein A3F45_00475 [Candidatus Curtissbacteria bacterium RIFCSPHIGHO2_12_FULL_41_17]|uniref:Uncharacterized protein n=1 Tax=Candidatus Curtissbacteria bacterium RIFCSPHIGHO2_12_FULL_41_17 TaxID=1797722 RepID=A0A1F5HL93_9BACT|nr:MAG: hypothetical protein A3F45_00475 [Candidatus Curtissbacteria bacterium RIFCSPHIGHO2_12_FULL_41_17]
MSYVKYLKKLQLIHPHLLTIRTRSSFGKTFKKILKSKNTQFIFLEKPKLEQMAAVLLLKILGKKFFWIQMFDNPPIPNLVTKLLISQADKITVSSRKLANRLIKFGIDKSKIKIVRG